MNIFRTFVRLVASRSRIGPVVDESGSRFIVPV